MPARRPQRGAQEPVPVGWKPGDPLTEAQQWTYDEANDDRETLIDHADRIDALASESHNFADSAVWTASHNKQGTPPIVCTDAAGVLLIGSNPEYGTGTVTVRFNGSATGTMRIY